MKKNQRTVMISSIAFACTISLGNPASAQTSDAPKAQDGNSTTALPDIVVTAQKRSESINTVPMSITAASGDTLRNMGVTSPDQLASVVPGFTFTKSAYGAPVYSLRGVGFYDYAIGAAPAVSVYVDEAPLPFSTITRGASFDLERVEVLKGPQGTLFGSNSTGGAVNYIAAKPTEKPEAGLDISFGRFNDADFSGFVSGPITDTLSARVAVRHEMSGDWQRSTTRNDTLGARNFTEGRASLAWKPASNVRASLTFGAFADDSDAQASQLIQINPLQPPFVSPVLTGLPLVSGDARAADWTPGLNPRHHDRQYQLTGRIDFDISDAVTLTSLTTHSYYKQRASVDPDGTALKLADTQDIGNIDSTFSELRLSGKSPDGALQWIVGGNYENDKINETQLLSAPDASGYRLFHAVFGVPTPDVTPVETHQNFETGAAFANLTYSFANRLTLNGGIRYTRTTVDFSGCTRNSLNGASGQALTIILGSLGVPVSYGPGSCTTLGPDLQPGLTSQSLTQNNVSWRVGVDYKTANGSLLYANISQGYKSGSFPTLPATSYAQYIPVKQEGILAYEAGFKARLIDRSLQLNGSLFYYDYTDKQTLGSVVLTPNIFGPLNHLVNIPKSHVTGAELQLNWMPVAGLKLSADATYLDTKIGDFTNYDPYGVVRNFNGESFPFTPKWQAHADIQYDWSVGGNHRAFVGGDALYHSRTNSGLGNYDILTIDPYTLLGLRAGFGAADNSWTLTVWGRNITNKYYWTNSYKIADVTARFAGMPATYGMSASIRF
ncbi:TonB-dependent receptor [Sphingomonas sp. CL5.1]|uniref:TonB-dependent receptor n=1 Tax=Sphingomonas sp. CL5.1 TaxID=2653203 RepID=UPI001582AB67|nr:TonB-dependent receptor [Sphingomonas sp. CL5.1]QKS01138.1 TonB-dependent receptor [Sphingomonas sp. CL5.1]